MSHLIRISGGTPSHNGTGSSGKEIVVQVPSNRIEPSSLYILLPQHYAKLVGGPDNKNLIASRQRLGETAGYHSWPWEAVEEKVAELFGKGKLRHVTTLEEALAEAGKIHRYWNAAMIAKS